jgi:hypothetical protein
MDKMWPDFLEMWSGKGFTNTKLRVVFPQPAPEIVEAVRVEPAVATEESAVATEEPAVAKE